MDSFENIARYQKEQRLTEGVTMQQLIKIGEMRSSSMERCNACPGSAILAGGEISESDEYAREGTAAHTLLEYCLRMEVSPESSIGTKMQVEGHDVTVSEDMAKAVGTATDWVNANEKPRQAEFERRLTGAAIGLPEWTGTVDYSRVADRHCTIVDYKHGASVTVEAIGNEQLLSYGALVMANADEPIETFSLVIIQPRGRGDAIKVWDTDFATVVAHVKRVSATARVVDYLTQNPAEALNRLHAGDHCQFCPAIAKCPVYGEPATEASLASLDADGYFLNATDAEIAYWYDNAKRFRKFLDRITELAKKRKDAGGMPGFKYVESLANRAWKDPAHAKAILVGAGLPVEITETKLLSPTKAEKLDPPEGMTAAELKEAVATLVHRPVRGLALVRDSDRRAPAGVDAVAEFDEVAT